MIMNLLKDRRTRRRLILLWLQTFLFIISQKLIMIKDEMNFLIDIDETEAGRSIFSKQNLKK